MNAYDLLSQQRQVADITAQGIDGEIDGPAAVVGEVVEIDQGASGAQLHGLDPSLGVIAEEEPAAMRRWVIVSDVKHSGDDGLAGRTGGMRLRAHRMVIVDHRWSQRSGVLRRADRGAIVGASRKVEG